MKTQRCFPFLLLTILLAASTTQAQFISGVGLKGGLAISDIRVTDIPGSGVNPYAVGAPPSDAVLSPAVSLFANFLYEEHFGLQAELTYLHKGASRTLRIPVTSSYYPDGTGDFYEITTESNLHYLVFALAAQPKLLIGEAALYAQIGPTVSYLVHVANYGSIEQFNQFQFGYTLGLGVDFGRLVDRNLFLEVRYSGDFSPFYDQGVLSYPNAKFWNRSWMVCLGTSF